ncbi:MAG: DUF4363 family protein [Clostridia bacterium]|nr:DUF4363 family protein [Clostridia bacterium]
MKFFIVALIILASVGVFCAWGSVESVDRIDSMMATLNEAKSDEQKVPSNAAEVSELFGKEWEENMFLISMLLPHHHLDEVKEKWVALNAYANTDEFAEWQEAKLVLEEELLHIRELIKISTDNIM